MGKYGITKAILKYPFKFLYRIKVTGKENEPDAPYIVCANHSSFVDPILITASIKAKPRWLAKRELSKHAFMRFVFRITNAIPISREGIDTKALHECVDTIKSGTCLGIFPQGTRMRKVEPTPEQAHAGLGLITGLAKATILPVSIVTKCRQPKIFRKTEIIIHKPIPYSELAEYGDKREMTAAVFAIVCEPFGKKPE